MKVEDMLQLHLCLLLLIYENELILAEAKLGSDDSGARGHLNNVRTVLAAQYGSNATGFPASSSTGAALKKEVLEEKYITLIGELVAYHDLRRTGNFIGVPNKLTGDNRLLDTHNVSFIHKMK